MKLGFIGGGVVGRATARAFIEHVDEVRVWDAVKERATHPLPQVLECDLVFVCLPEAVVEPFFKNTLSACTHLNYVVKSTVPIGTTRRLHEAGFKNVVHSPEFLTERCAVEDAQIPARNIIGMPDRHARLQETVIYPGGEQMTINFPTQICCRELRRLYESRFPGVPCLAMSSDESEAVKLIQNTFFATKVSFFNEARNLCDAMELDWDRVLGALLADGRIGSSHTKVPGPDGLRGFGGKCLPKDAKAFALACMEVGVRPRMAHAALRRCSEDRKEAK